MTTGQTLRQVVALAVAFLVVGCATTPTTRLLLNTSHPIYYPPAQVCFRGHWVGPIETKDYYCPVVYWYLDWTPLATPSRSQEESCGPYDSAVPNPFNFVTCARYGGGDHTVRLVLRYPNGKVYSATTKVQDISPK